MSAGDTTKDYYSMKFFKATGLSLLVCTAALAQSVALMPMPKIQFTDQNGAPLSGGYLYTCQAGLSCTPGTVGSAPLNPLATYTDSTGLIANQNPIVLDSAGRASVWLGSGSYKIAAQDQYGVPQWTQDNVSSTSLHAQALASGSAANFASLAVTSNATVGGKLTTGDVVTKGPYLDIRAFGAVGDGTTDTTVPFNLAVSAACAGGNIPILFPVGQFVFKSKPNSIGCGLWIMGSGNGSTPQFGTAIESAYTETTATNGLFTFDGSYGTGFQGTGGGVRNLTIFKNQGYTGGTPIKITGADCSHRAGWITIEDVLTSTNGGGTWNKGLVIDGSACTVSGGQGVRDINIRHFWPAVMSDGDSSIYFNNAVQVFWFGGEIFPASGGGTTGITITGNASGTAASTNIFIADVYFIGNVVVDQSATVVLDNVYVGGNFQATNNAVGCQLSGAVGGTIDNTGGCEVKTATSFSTHAPFNSSIQFNKTLGIGSAPVGNAAVWLNGAGTSQTQGSGTAQFGIDAAAYVGTDATSLAAAMAASLSTSAGAQTYANVYGYYFSQGTKGSGNTWNNQYGYYCGSLTNATSNWCYYESGTSPNYYGGSVETGVGFRVSGSAGLSVVKNLKGSDGNNCTETFTGGILTASSCP